MCIRDRFLTEQMSAKRGLKVFGKDGADAIVSEMNQLHIRKTIKPVQFKDLTREQKVQALRYLMFLKQKRCGKIKARGCADGRKQRVYKTKAETSSPTVTTEGLFITAVIDAREGRYVVTVDIPGAFMHADMDELIHMKIEGALAELLVRVDPETYGPYMTVENGKKVIYVQLTKALYGTLQAALLFWNNLVEFLTKELGFTLNKYDRCVANKIINGKQCTVVWHVDDLKISHVDPLVLEQIISKLSDRYGKEAPLTVTRGTVHDYLGMTIDYSTKGKVQFRMADYVEGILDELPEEMNGTAVTPASNHLFNTRDDTEILDTKRADTYHHLTAKLLYLSKRARPDLQTAVAFLCTRVSKPDMDDWKKLRRCLCYLRATKHMHLTLEASEDQKLQWWVDASFAVHKDMRSHTGATLSLGKGSVYSSSTRQKLNTKSSTEAELVGVDDAMPTIVWTRRFLEDQGYHVTDNVVYQDNQSAMLLERNGRASSGRRTRHIDIRYFFVANRIKDGELRVEHCSTDQMVADFFTKPLQGAAFRKMRQRILNLPPSDTSELGDTPQERVGTCTDSGESGRTWADVVAGKPGNSPPKGHGMTPTINNGTTMMTVVGLNNKPRRGGQRKHLRGNKHYESNRDSRTRSNLARSRYKQQCRSLII